MTQEDLAARMADLGHEWGRSTVSAAEGKSRKVTIDELFGLAVSFGVTIGQLLDPTGPDHSRRLRLDVGGNAGIGNSGFIEPDVAQLWSASRAVVRLWQEDGRTFALDVADDLPIAAQRELEALRAEAERPTTGS
jgi:transcriptional regulator with XRE-family HTH domain